MERERVEALVPGTEKLLVGVRKGRTLAVEVGLEQVSRGVRCHYTGVFPSVALLLLKERFIR